jgi:hypothetical protein
MGTRILKAVTDARGVGAQRPPAGLIWEFLRVKIVNRSHQPLPFNRFDFQVVDRQGEIFRPTISLEGRPALGSGRLPAGRAAAGWIGFQLPADIGTFSLTWSDGYHLTPPAEILQYALPGQ